MITELRVRDLATIADVTLQLGPGLNVLTGETGAGKSMLVDALALLLGERAAGGSVRPGAARSVVEGAFEGLDATTRRRIEELGLDVEEGRVVVRREVAVEGRSRAWVNGSPTTASVLAQLGALLVDLHGQHETQSLLHSEAQRDILDARASHCSSGPPPSLPFLRRRPKPEGLPNVTAVRLPATILRRGITPFRPRTSPDECRCLRTPSTD